MTTQPLVRPLPTILMIALLLRLVIALRFWNIIGPDEVFQSLEQAHRLVFGQGVVPWEFQVGLRCWLIPLALAAPMALARLLDPDPMAGLILIRILLCIASLGIVWAAAKWGEQFYGQRGAWIAGLFTACWPDLWLMAPHPLEEVLAADVLVPAIYLIGQADTGRRVAWAGLLLGLAFTLRLQLAPAIAIAGIVLCGRRPGRWVIAVGCAAIPVVAAGMLDWLSWGTPFRSFWLNIYLNVFLGVAKNDFGASPPLYFISMLALDWLWSLPVILFLAWRGAAKLPLTTAMAVSIIATHTLLAHKEFRFILPAIALVIPVAGVGVASIWSKAFAKRAPFRLVLALMLIVGPILSPWTYFMLDWQTDSFRAFRILASEHAVLISLQGWDQTFHSFMPFDIVFDQTTRLTGTTITQTPAGPVEADAIVATKPAQGIPATFMRQVCFAGTWIPFSKPGPGFCVWHRFGKMPEIGGAATFTLPSPPAIGRFKVADHLPD